eukprot:106101-Pelagomonas_calceolata.AAC.2
MLPMLATNFPSKAPIFLDAAHNTFFDYVFYFINNSAQHWKGQHWAEQGSGTFPCKGIQSLASFLPSAHAHTKPRVGRQQEGTQKALRRHYGRPRSIEGMCTCAHCTDLF